MVVTELANGQRLPANRDGIRILPTFLDPLGGDSLGVHYQREAADCIISLIDVWGLNSGVMQQLNWFPYTPIDTRPVAPHVYNALQHCKVPIAMSRYGETEIRKCGLDCFYMPHAIDPAIWHPRDKQQCRAKLGIDPHVFFVSFVGVNDSSPSRKGIPELLAAWQIFSDRHPDSQLYLHTTRMGNKPLSNQGGVNLDAILTATPIDPMSLRFADEYLLRTAFSAENMAAIAAAADVLILPTRGEGFGLPVLEYARVGTPAIVTDVASSTELCFDGWLLEYEPEWSWQDAWVAKPGIASIVDNLEAAYADRNNPRRKANCIEGARDYDIDIVFPQYAIPLLQRLSEYVLDTVAV